MMKNKKGITLIELIISLGIIAIVFALIAPLMFSGFQYFSNVNNMVMDQTNLRKIMTDVCREVRDANAVTVVSETEIIVDNCTYKYVADSKEITKHFADTDTTVVVSRRVERFEISQTDSVIEFEVQAEGNSSTIVTKINLRQRAMPTPEIA